MDFSNELIVWYLENKRDLPWRNTTDPYKIWLSEIILQQTRVQQGMDYYLKFIAHYPTVKHLAEASEDAVLKDWQGLGYYSRARNLHFSAQYITTALNGIFPNTYKEIIKLKGVGDYTASAIASFCFKESTAVVDGNVYRLLSRYFDIDIPINSPKGIKYFKTLAQTLIKDVSPDIFNQAIMEFGAMACKPKNPECDSCIFKDSCLAFNKNKIDTLPVKEKKIKIKHRYLNFLVLNIDHQTFLEKRIDNGIWKNLYQFPLIEAEKNVTQSELTKLITIDSLTFNPTEITLYNTTPITHKLTHQHLYIQFWMVQKANTKHLNMTHWNDVEQFAIPKPIDNFISLFKNR